MNQVEKVGQTRGFLKLLSQVMENDNFRELFSHFTTWDDTKAIILLMKVYRLISDKLKAKNVEITGEQMVILVQSALSNGEMRRFITIDMANFVDRDVEFNGGHFGELVDSIIIQNTIANTRDERIRNDIVVGTRLARQAEEQLLLEEFDKSTPKK
jgi:hypothetical protein